MSVLVAVSAAVVVGILYVLLGYPTSLKEAQFRYRAEAIGERQEAKLKLAELAPFEWEEVCEHHGYDGDFKHPRSGRLYAAPSAAAQDGVWSLLFIQEDGSPTYVIGSCKRGGIRIDGFGCLPRNKAVLNLVTPGDCPTYK